MADYGTITVHVFTSDAQIPVPAAAVTIRRSLADDAEILDQDVTDRSGLTKPFQIETPPRSASQTPEGGKPYSEIAISVEHPNYEKEEISGVQIFPATVTLQVFQLIPLAPEFRDKTTTYTTPPQNL